jgi:putative membrane protein
MNQKRSILLSVVISAVLVAAAIGLLFWHNTGMWLGDAQGETGYLHMRAGGMGIVMILFWVVLIGALGLLVSGTINGVRSSQQADGDFQKPLEILKKRYARGEIDKVEYEDKRRALST